jgi:hypothetical protein
MSSSNRTGLVTAGEQIAYNHSDKEEEMEMHPVVPGLPKNFVPFVRFFFLSEIKTHYTDANKHRTILHHELESLDVHKWIRKHSKNNALRWYVHIFFSSSIFSIFTPRKKNPAENRRLSQIR